MSEEERKTNEERPPESSTPEAQTNGASSGASSGDSSKSKPKKEKKPKAEKPPVEGEQKGLAEQKRIFNERKRLKSELKSQGITSRKTFNQIAKDQGLQFFKSSPTMAFLRSAGAALASSLGVKAIAVGAAAVLITTFAISTITEAKGSFTINLTGDMLDAGFILSDTADFKELKTRLISEKLQNVNNITLEDIDPEVDNIDGPHNGEHYVAYTFYIKNDGKKAHSYAWYVNMTDETLGVSKAVWVMVFEDGKQVIYTRPTDEGEPEELFGFSKELSFAEQAYDREAQYYSEYDTEAMRELHGIKTTPYANENTVAQGLVENVEPGGVHKYTIVIWVEGYDPECTDDIFGGFAKFEMQIDSVPDGDPAGAFDGVFRTEFEDYGKTDTGTESESESEVDS